MSFKLSVARWAKEQEIGLNAAVRQVTLELATRVILRSPVADPLRWKHPRKGYVGGHFRANWRIGIDAPASGTTEATDPGGDQTRASIVAALPAKASGHVIYITNNLPYAWRLETGWSKQAPLGMVGLTSMEFSSIVDGVRGGLGSISVTGA